MNRDGRRRDESPRRDVNDPLAPLDGGGGAELEEQVPDAPGEGAWRQDDGEAGVGSAVDVSQSVGERVSLWSGGNFPRTPLSLQREHVEYHRAAAGGHRLHSISCLFELILLCTYHQTWEL